MMTETGYYQYNTGDDQNGNLYNTSAAAQSLYQSANCTSALPSSSTTDQQQQSQFDPEAKSRLFNYYGGMAGFHNPVTSGITDNALHMAYSAAAAQGSADHNSNTITNTVLNTTGNHQMLPQVPSGLQCHPGMASAAAVNMNHQGWTAAQSVFDHMAAAQAFGNRSSSAISQQTQGTSPTVARAIAAAQNQKRPRSEKKAIPTDQKDIKYFERRKRNNQAAKKSRDARKAREDEIAIRASFLEKENAILRAQTATLREEANSLKQLLLQKTRHRQ